MSRRREAEKRKLLPDPKFGSVQLARLINVMMKNGKKSISEHIAYRALSIIEDKKKVDGLEFFIEAIKKLQPRVEVKRRRVGGATYQVPVPVRESRANALALRWLVRIAKGRNEKSMAVRLAAELMDVEEGRGGAIRRRDESHKAAEANKAFSHFRY